MKSASMNTDVLVIGGGPAGLSAAIAARLKGFRVAVVETAHPPIDKSCGEGLMPEGVAGLRQLGIELRAEDGFAFRGLRFADERTSVEAKIEHGTGFGVRRTTLHRLLVERAAQVGVEFEWGARASEFRRGEIVAAGKRIAYRWLVGADGWNSAVQRWAGLVPRRAPRTRCGFRKHFAISPWSDSVEVHWRGSFQIYITPTTASEVCVSAISDDPALRVDGALACVPALAEKIVSAPPCSAERGGVTALRTLRRVTRENVALVGDASGTVDAVAGQGLALAVQQAICLADALERGELSSYDAAHREMMQTPVRMTRLLLWMGHNPRIRRRILRLLADRPRLFEKMLAIHTGAPAHTRAGAGELLGIAREMLRP